MGLITPKGPRCYIRTVGRADSSICLRNPYALAPPPPRTSARSPSSRTLRALEGLVKDELVRVRFGLWPVPCLGTSPIEAIAEGRASPALGPVEDEEQEEPSFSTLTRSGP